jgi:hypothetical protein
MPHFTSEPGKIETAVSWLVLVALAVVAWGVYSRQFIFTPFDVNGESPRSLADSKESGEGLASMAESPLAGYAGEKLEPMSAMETFDRDTMSDKIDGKAELYLPAGVVDMRCQRFAVKAAPADWAEVFVYDMDNPANAFTVWSKQKRPGVTDVGELAYETKNSLHFAHGKYYVEIVASAPSDAILTAMEEYRQNFIAKTAGAKTGPMGELAMFPPEGLQQGSISRSTSDEFGIEGFDNIYTAVYEVEGVEVTAFLSPRPTAKEAEGMAATYAKYFEPFGGKAAPAGGDLPGAAVVELMGTYKVVLSGGRWVGGVHESTSRSAALKVAAMLTRRLSEVKP